MTLTEEQLNELFKYEASFHDAVWEACDVSCTTEQLKALFNELPPHIQATGIAWSIGDTVFRDEVYTWIQQTKWTPSR